MKIKHSHFLLMMASVMLICLLVFPQVVRGAPTATFAVNNAGDTNDLNPGDGICGMSGKNQCTLRAAIQETNALDGCDTITLGLITVYPQSDLPALTDTRGTIIQGNGVSSVLDGISAGTNAIGLKVESDHNIIQGLIIQSFDGYAIRTWWVSDNLIGTDGDGTNDAAERNVIAGNLGWGIRVFEKGDGLLIAGNSIGVNASGAALGNSKSGVYLDSAYGVEVGGASPTIQNIIANNGGDGITVGSAASSTKEINNILRGNALYANTDLGIDLGNDGVTANDTGDADSGPNALQNYPILSGATSNSTTTTITGTLNSKSNTSYWIDFYASPACDTSGCGEVQIYLGRYTVTTDASGNASFVASLSAAIPDGAAITATVTGSNKGETSEFSPCVVGIVTEYRIYLPLVIR